MLFHLTFSILIASPLIDVVRSECGEPGEEKLHLLNEAEVIVTFDEKNISVMVNFTDQTSLLVA